MILDFFNLKRGILWIFNLEFRFWKSCLTFKCRWGGAVFDPGASDTFGSSQVVQVGVWWVAVVWRSRGIRWRPIAVVFSSCSGRSCLGSCSGQHPTQARADHVGLFPVTKSTPGLVTTPNQSYFLVNRFPCICKKVTSKRKLFTWLNHKK